MCEGCKCYISKMTGCKHHGRPSKLFSWSNCIRKKSLFIVSTLEIPNPCKLPFLQIFLLHFFSTRCNALWRLLGSVNICCFSRLGCHEDRGRFFFLKLRKKWTYMLSQNLVRVLGFSWLRLCRNQRWMLRTSQSSCLESPSNRFSSGCYETRHQKKTFLSIFFLLTPFTSFRLHMVKFLL